MTNTALVLGGSGLVGQSLMRLLIDDTHWDRIIAVTRRSLGINSSKLVEVIRDTTNIEQAPEDLAADTVFCCLGTTKKKAGGRENFRKIDHDYIVRCAEIAHQQGATRFIVVSSIGAKVGSPSYYTHIKGKTERDLKAIGFDTLDILQPSLLLGNREESRPAEELGGYLLPIISFLMVGPLRKYRAIRAKQVAKAMAAIALIDHKGTSVHTNDQLASF